MPMIIVMMQTFCKQCFKRVKLYVDSRKPVKRKWLWYVRIVLFFIRSCLIIRLSRVGEERIGM